MYPELRSDNAARKPLYWLEQGRVYGPDGRRRFDIDRSELPSGALCYTESLTTPSLADSLASWAANPSSKVIATDVGKVIAARLGSRTTTWVVGIDSWDGDNPGPPFIKELDEDFDYIGVGSYPTPSSLGRGTMRHVYRTQRLGIHTALPVSCEQYLLSNGFGGIVVTPKSGIAVPEAYQQDLSSAWVSVYDKHPDKTPECFGAGADLGKYVTWFGEVTIEVPNTLALGIFPVRKSDKGVKYPTRKGVYKTHVWSETAASAERQGCKVTVKEGWGWESWTEDNQSWAEWIFTKRQEANSERQEKRVKKVAVSAIGSQGRGRDCYVVVGPELYNPETDYPVCDGSAPLNLWVHPERDNRSPTMVHWNHFTINAANSVVRDFAYPYAERGELLLIDYDAAFVTGSEPGTMRKGSVESLVCKPGTWLWKLHHNFRILRNRMWISDEEPARYGSLLKEVL